MLRLISLAGVYGGMLAPVAAFNNLTASPHVFFTTIVLQATIALTMPAFLLLAWRQPAYRPRRAWLSMALGAYFVALSLSCVFAFNRHRAFWGSQDRMGGLFSLAHFFAWYVMATSMVRTWRDWRRVLHWQVALGLYVALVALLDLRDPTIDRISGVLGNPIYCGTYQVFFLGILALLWVRTQGSAPRKFYAVCAAISLAVLAFTGSRGPMLGLASGLGWVVVMWAIMGRRWLFLAVSLASLLLAGVGYMSIVRMGPSWTQHLGGLEHLFTKSTYEERPMIWSIAFAGFRDHPLVGWGLDSYEAVFDTHFLPRFVCDGNYDSWTDVAHSLLFEHLSTTGALGTLAYAAVWIALALSLFRARRQGWIEARSHAVLLGLSVAYLVQGQFITDSPSSHAMVFLLLAAGCAASFPEFSAEPVPLAQPVAERPIGRSPWAGAILQAGGVLWAWYGAVSPGLASYASLQSMAALKEGGCGAMLENARRVATMSTPWSEDQLTVVSYTLREFVKQDKLQACPQWRDLYDLARQRALAIYAGPPDHFRFGVVMPALANMVGLKSHDPGLLKEAQQRYEALIAGSPNRQLYRYRYASHLAETGRLQESGEQLVEAVATDPEMGESLWRLGAFRMEYETQPEMGSKLIVQAADGVCRHLLSSLAEAKLLAQAFLVQGNLEGLRSMERRISELPPEEPRPASTYLDIARIEEQAGLVAERDTMVRLAAAQDATLRARLAPLFNGRVATIAEAEQVMAPAVTPP